MPHVKKPITWLLTGELARARTRGRKILPRLENIAPAGSFGHTGCCGGAAGLLGTGNAARASATARTAIGSMLPARTLGAGSHVAPGGAPMNFEGALGSLAGAGAFEGAFEGASAINTWFKASKAAFQHACLAGGWSSACSCFPSACRALCLALDPAESRRCLRSALAPAQEGRPRLRAEKATRLACRHMCMGEGRTSGLRDVRDGRDVQEPVCDYSRGGRVGRRALRPPGGARCCRAGGLCVGCGRRELDQAGSDRRSRRYGSRRCVLLPFLRARR